MKKKSYLFGSLLILISGIAAGFYGLQLLGFFNKDQLLVRALSCNDCAAYEIIAGQSKIASQIQNSSDSITIAQAYITGERNPLDSDYTKTFDYYLVTGKVTGLQKSASGITSFPVITARQWKHFDLRTEWLLAFLTTFLFIAAIRYFIKFRKANRPDATESSLLTHSNPPVKNP